MGKIKNSEADHLSNASVYIRLIYERYRMAILQLGNDVSICPTEKKYNGFRVNGRRIANFHIGKQSFKIWFNVRPGTLRDSRSLTRQTDKGHTIRVEDEANFEYIVSLLGQAYIDNR